VRPITNKKTLAAKVKIGVFYFVAGIRFSTSPNFLISSP